MNVKMIDAQWHYISTNGREQRVADMNHAHLLNAYVKAIEFQGVNPTARQVAGVLVTELSRRLQGFENYQRREAENVGRN